jgi:hypothetical protein
MRESLAALGLDGVPSRTDQDARDAIAAALIARDYEHRRFQPFGAIVVPEPPDGGMPLCARRKRRSRTSRWRYSLLTGLTTR